MELPSGDSRKTIDGIESPALNKLSFGCLQTSRQRCDGVGTRIQECRDPGGDGLGWNIFNIF